MLKGVYESEIENLLLVVRSRGDENARLKTQLETEKLQFRLLIENAEK